MDIIVETKPTILYQKLLLVQKEVGTIVKDSENPFFKSSYFDINKLLEVTKPILSKHGLVLLQPLQVTGHGNILATVIIDTESGEKLESQAILSNNPDPQKMGSIITYFRRYALQSFLALQAEDDDGNASVSGNSGLQQMITQPKVANPIKPTYSLGSRILSQPSTSKLASQKQIDLIISLSNQRGKALTDQKFMKTLNSSDASVLITNLMSTPVVKHDEGFMPEEHIDDPYDQTFTN